MIPQPRLDFSTASSRLPSSRHSPAFHHYARSLAQRSRHNSPHGPVFSSPRHSEVYIVFYYSCYYFYGYV
ncbi:unnamed protein product [Rhodiola kirilowii]